MIGKNQVPKIFAKAFAKLGIKNADTLRGHALRGIFGAKLANAKDVNLKEGMQAMSCKRKIIQMHRRVQDLERLQRSQMSSYPYRNSNDEYNSLYKDSLENDSLRLNHTVRC